MSKVLQLNADYRPMKLISYRDAVSLIEDGDAIPATDELATVIKTVNGDYPIPSILVLQRYVGVPHRTKNWTKHNVLERDNYTCIYCGLEAKGKEQKLMTVDHIHPQSRGGKDTWSNTACACLKCNQRKANRTPKEANMPLLWEPKRPRTNYLVATSKVRPEWKDYLGDGYIYPPQIRDDL